MSSILTQEEIDKLLSGAPESAPSLPEEKIDDLAHDLNFLKGIETVIKKPLPRFTIQEIERVYNFRAKFEDDTVYICSDCGHEMTQNLVLRSSHNHSPVLTCLHCHVTIPKPMRRKNG